MSTTQILLRAEGSRDKLRWCLIKIRTANESSFHKVHINQIFKTGKFQESSQKLSGKLQFWSSWCHCLIRLHSRDFYNMRGYLLIKTHTLNESSFHKFQINQNFKPGKSQEKFEKLSGKLKLWPSWCHYKARLRSRDSHKELTELLAKIRTTNGNYCLWFFINQIPQTRNFEEITRKLSVKLLF